MADINIMGTSGTNRQRFVAENQLSSEQTPMTPSGDYRAMEIYWYMVETLLEGTLAVRAAGQSYLPKFPNESQPDYEYRRGNAKYTNIYRDIVENLAAKPFAKELRIKDGSSSPAVDDLMEDIDGQGDHLHIFSAHIFFQAINDAIHWIFVDKPPVPSGSSVAVEKSLGARPYWVSIPAKRMLAVYSDMVDGKEEIVHCRIWEPTIIRDNYAEREVTRVRELNRDKLSDGSYGPARYTVWEEVRQLQTQKAEWIKIEEGLIAIGIIAVVPVIMGRRKGTSWRFVPPMQDAAYLQVEHYQQETNLKSIKEQAAFPMLSGNGVAPETDELGKAKMVPVGPKTVLYAPPTGESARPGSWTFIEPAASSLSFLAADVKATEQQLREIGRQPLTAQTGNLTVVTTAFAAQKGNSAIQAWALNLKDALEQALKYTCLWLGEGAQPEVIIHSDFAIDLESPEAPVFLLALRQNRDISRKSILAEGQRRDYLAPEFDADEDQAELDLEEPASPTPNDIKNALPPFPPAPGNPPQPPFLKVVKPVGG